MYMISTSAGGSKLGAADKAGVIKAVQQQKLALQSQTAWQGLMAPPDRVLLFFQAVIMDRAESTRCMGRLLGPVVSM